ERWSECWDSSRSHCAGIVALVPRTATLLRGLLFFYSATAPPEIYTLSLHDALPICQYKPYGSYNLDEVQQAAGFWAQDRWRLKSDRKSTRLNSSHVAISYAVFCLKKKKQYTRTHRRTCPTRITQYCVTASYTLQTFA